MKLPFAIIAQYFLTVALLSPSISAYAEITSTENLYKVELVIFEHLYFDTSNTAEYWPKSIYLEYPSFTKELIDPDIEKQRQKEQLERIEKKKALMLSKDFLDSNVVITPADETQNIGTDSDFALESGTDQAQLPNGLDSSTDVLANAPESSIDSVSTPEEQLLASLNTLEFLNDSYKHLGTQVDAMSRNRAYRILMHETWLQNMAPREEAPALLIDAGNQYGNNFELQGTITLHIARYLHIATDLWLSQFVPNVGQESDYWPSIPVSPALSKWLLAEDSFIQSEAFGEIGLNTSSASNGFKLNLNQYSNKNDSNPFSTANHNAYYGSTNREQQLDWSLDNETKPEYLVTQISTLRQKRRMRSDELHYIDHPKFGILIKIIPFKLSDFTESENTLSANHYN